MRFVFIYEEREGNNHNDNNTMRVLFFASICSYKEKNITKEKFCITIYFVLVSVCLHTYVCVCTTHYSMSYKKKTSLSI